MSRSSLFESLESRRLLSLSVFSLYGPLTTGANETYASYTNGKLVNTQVREIMGPAVYDGHETTRVKTTFTAADGEVSTDEQYVAEDNTLGIVYYGDVYTVMDKDTPKVETTKYEPYLRMGPATITAGETFKFTYTEDVQTVVGGKTTKESDQITLSESLVSNTPQSLTVPAGTFKAYEAVVKYTSSGNTSTSDVWFVPGVGIVKTVSGDSTKVMTSYKS